MMEKGRRLRKTVIKVSYAGFYCLVFTLILLAVACTNKDKIPADVLVQDKMEKVMWDMIAADRFSSQFLERDSAAKRNIKVENLKLYERVFQHHKISKEEFLRSFQFYLSRPDLNKVIFDTMSARSERRRAEMYKADTAKAVK